MWLGCRSVYNLYCQCVLLVTVTLIEHPFVIHCLILPCLRPFIAIARQRTRAESYNRERTPPSHGDWTNRRAPPSSHALGQQRSQRGVAPLACSQTPWLYRQCLHQRQVKYMAPRSSPPLWGRSRLDELRRQQWMGSKRQMLPALPPCRPNSTTTLPVSGFARQKTYLKDRSTYAEDAPGLDGGIGSPQSEPKTHNSETFALTHRWQGAPESVSDDVRHRSLWARQRSHAARKGAVVVLFILNWTAGRNGDRCTILVDNGHGWLDQAKYRSSYPFTAQPYTCAKAIPSRLGSSCSYL